MRDEILQAMPFFTYVSGKPRVDLDFVWAPFLFSMCRVLNRCAERGHNYYCTRAHSTFSAQDALHALWKAGKGGRAVKGGLSAHQYGIGLDFAADSDESRVGLQLDGDSWTKEAYRVLGEEIAAENERLGFPFLAWGRDFNDYPHVGIEKFESASELAPLRKAYLAANGDEEIIGALSAAWVLLEDTHREALDLAAA